MLTLYDIVYKQQSFWYHYSSYCAKLPQISDLTAGCWPHASLVIEHRKLAWALHFFPIPLDAKSHMDPGEFSVGDCDVCHETAIREKERSETWKWISCRHLETLMLSYWQLLYLEQAMSISSIFAILPTPTWKPIPICLFKKTPEWLAVHFCINPLKK